jgi:hypothetical protein
MSTSVHVDSFLQYLIDKYFVFDPKAELDESNTIDDISILKKGIGEIKFKKVTDENMVDLCKKIFDLFRCFNIEIPLNLHDQLSSDNVCKIYMHYKRYKCSSSSHTRETETSLVLDNTLKTNDTYYVDSLEDITTRDLKQHFGNYILSGDSGDDFRYEYRFRFAKDNRVYKFSLYDYKNDDGEFYEEDDIYWHVASDTDKKDVNKSFIQYLCQKIQDVDCC